MSEFLNIPERPICQMCGERPVDLQNRDKFSGKSKWRNHCNTCHDDISNSKRHGHPAYKGATISGL